MTLKTLCAKGTCCSSNLTNSSKIAHLAEIRSLVRLTFVVMEDTANHAAWQTDLSLKC
jgi:hypothetical protein